MKVNIDKNLCRSCFTHDAEHDLGENAIFEQYEYVTCQKLSTDNGLPMKICRSCIFRLKIAYDFKKQCEHSSNYMDELMKTINVSFSRVQSNAAKTYKLNASDINLLNKSGYYTEKNQCETNIEPLMDNEMENQNGNESEEYLDAVIVEEKYADDDPLINDFNKSSDSEMSSNLLEISFDHTENIQHNSTSLSTIATIIERLECKECNKSFKNKSNLNKHINGHDRPYQCEQCGQRFTQKTVLKGHINGKHTNSRSFECHHCGLLFNFKKTLKRHLLRRHFSIKLYVCDECNVEFKFFNELKQHKKVVHLIGQPEEQPPQSMHICNICSKQFKWKQSLSKHLKEHSTSFSCRECSHIFESIAQLKEHRRIHKPIQQPYKCDQCDREFTRQKFLQLHKQQHSKSDLQQLNANRGGIRLRYLCASKNIQN